MFNYLWLLKTNSICAVCDAFKMLFKKKVLGMILKKCFKNKQNGKEANFRLTSYFVEGYLCLGNQIVLHFSCHIYEGK